jgi:subtilisin
MRKITILTLVLLTSLSAGVAVPLAAAKSQNEKLVRVLVGFDKPVGASEQAIIRASGGKLKYSYSIVNAVAAQIPESALYGLARNPHVTSVEIDDTVQAVDIELDNSWGVKRIKAGEVQITPYNNKGTGVKIGIIDSGINYNHLDLKDNYVGGYDFYYYDDDPMDVFGHGTHVAGSACAEDNDNGLTDIGGNPLYGVLGVASDCDLYSLRVLNENGVGYFSDIVAAVEWSTGATVHIQNVFTGEWLTIQGVKMDVINLSLGQSRNPGGVVKAAFDNAEAAGVVIVAAAGNSGNAGGKGTNTIYPANYDSVIAVGATDLSNNRATFSSTGDAVEVVAPGVNVYSSWNDDTDYYGNLTTCRNGDANDCYKYGSGTSMASPHVAGVAALIIAAGYTDYNGDGVVNNRDVRAVMQGTATDLGSAGRDSQFGYGLVNALLAVQTADEDVNSPPVANAGADQTVVDSDGNGFENVSLNGSGSFDLDGYIVSYEWYEGATLLATGTTPTINVAVGNHTITLVVIDNEGATGSDSTQVNVTQQSSGGTNCPPGWAKKGICTP